MSLRSFQPNRRGFLTVGALTGLGLSLGDYFQLRQARAEQKHYDFIEAKAKSVIHIYLPGGISHQETFDPKPFAPIEYRGEMGSIPTKIPGEVFSETLPKTADVADKICVLRGFSHGEAAPRTRHPQHVHRQSPQPGFGLSQHG